VKAVPAVLAIAALAGCATDGPAVQAHSEYAELVELRGHAVTMLEHHDITVDEARMVRVMLDVARRAADSGQTTMAQTELDAVRAYLKSRQGGSL